MDIHCWTLWDEYSYKLVNFIMFMSVIQLHIKQFAEFLIIWTRKKNPLNDQLKAAPHQHPLHEKVITTHDMFAWFVAHRLCFIIKGSWLLTGLQVMHNRNDNLNIGFAFWLPERIDCHHLIRRILNNTVNYMNMKAGLIQFSGIVTN